MKRTPTAVIPIPLDRLRKRHDGCPDGESFGQAPGPPLSVLVVDEAATERGRVCRAGRRAAGRESQWFEAADADTAFRTLALSDIALVVADCNTIRHGLAAWTEGAAAASGRPFPLVVVLSADNEPQAIQQMLDAGAECCLPKHLPLRLLECELRRLVLQARGKARLS